MTRSQLDVRLGSQVPTIQHSPPGVVSLAAAEEAIELADAYGVADGNPLSESQKITLRNGLGERADGSWAATRIADFGPRQGTGKNDKIAARELAGLLLFGEKLIIHTAHEFPTANESFLRLVAVFDAWDDLRRKVARIRYANGEQGIELLTGQRLKYRARTGGSGRGFAKADLVVYDEAQHLGREHVAASGPAKMANPNSQTWYAGSGGLVTSAVAWAVRSSALLHTGGRLAYTEMTGERITVADGRFTSVSPDPLDRDVWYQCIPGLGRWVTEEAVEAMFDELGPELFAREVLCVWDPLPGGQAEAKLPAAAWAATVGPDLPRDTPMVAVTFDVTKDSEWSSVAWSAGSLQAPYVEVREHRKGAGWLPDYLVDLIQREHPSVVACNGAGPAGAAVGPILAAFKAAGLSADLLVQMNAGEYKQACGGFYTDVVEGRLRRPAGQGPLDLAAADATERVLGDAWAWDRRSATVPISPLVAVTIARAVLPTESSTRVFAY